MASQDYYRNLSRYTWQYSNTAASKDLDLTRVEDLKGGAVGFVGEEKIPLDRFDKDANVSILCEDCLDVCEDLKKDGLNPVCLNLASERTPGGGWRNGRMAQEESIFYRSTLCVSLNKDLYPIKLDRVLYSPHVQVFLDSDYKKLASKDIYTLSFITCPGIRHPILTDGEMNGKDYTSLKYKIHTILKVAAIKGHDAIVLGALGCGVFQCPVADVAAAFKEVIPYYRRFFKEIVFAILEDSKGTYTQFVHHFGTLDTPKLVEPVKPVIKPIEKVEPVETAKPVRPYKTWADTVEEEEFDIKPNPNVKNIKPVSPGWTVVGQTKKDIIRARNKKKKEASILRHKRS